MNTQRHIGSSYRTQLRYVVLLPVFFVAFCALYDPFGMKTYYQVGGLGCGFHFILLTVILAAVLALTRLVFCRKASSSRRGSNQRRSTS